MEGFFCDGFTALEARLLVVRLRYIYHTLTFSLINEFVFNLIGLVLPSELYCPSCAKLTGGREEERGDGF